jgi:predicted Fe-Mo cluster-binding NifX family protein
MKNGRIAVPSIEGGGLKGIRSGHFGHCDVFTLIDVKDSKIKSVSTINNIEHDRGGGMELINLLVNHQVNTIIVTGIGIRPLKGFNEVCIDVFYEVDRVDIKPVVDDLIAGKIPLIKNNQACGGGAA